MRSPKHDSVSVTLVRLIVSAVLAVMSCSVFAEREKVWSRWYAVSIPFNEATTKASARALALERARGLAANEFGSAILTDEEMKDGVLKERTRVVTAGVSRMSVKSEAFQQNEKGLVTGEFNIEVQISQDELQRQFDAMRRDASRDQKLRTLQRENELLAARLKGNEGQAQAEAIVLQDLLKNSPRSTTPELVFPRGALMSLAVMGDRSPAIWDLIEEGLFRPLRTAEYRVNFSSAEMDGNEVKLRLNVHWKLDLSFMRAKSLGYAPTYSQLPGAQYAEGFCIEPRKEPRQVYKDLMDEAVWLEVQVGSRNESFMIGGPVNSLWCVANGEMGAGKLIELTIPSKDALSAGEIRSRVVRGRSIGSLKVSDLSQDLMRSYFYRR